MFRNASAANLLGTSSNAVDVPNRDLPPPHPSCWALSAVGPLDTATPSSFDSWVTRLESLVAGSAATFESTLPSGCASCWSEDGPADDIPFSPKVYAADPTLHSAAVLTPEDAYLADRLFEVVPLARSLGIVGDEAVEKMRANVIRGKKSLKHYVDYLSGEVETYVKE